MACTVHTITATLLPEDEDDHAVVLRYVADHNIQLRRGDIINIPIKAAPIISTNAQLG